MTRIVEIDPREITITPVFKTIEVENIPKSETAGRAILEIKEVVEVRFAGSKNYSPIFPADAFWKREGNRVITYAERWPEQYRQYKEGSPQEAHGTPLEMLREYGLTPENISLCRALRIYSIEALHNLEGPGIKALGMNSNKLKEAAAAYMAERLNSQNAYSEIEKLKMRIAELESVSTVPPVVDNTPEQIEAIVEAADNEYQGKSDTELKDLIEQKTGARPRGNPSRPTLENILEQLKAA